MKKKAFIVAAVSVGLFIIVLMTAVYFHFAPSNVKRDMAVQYKELGKNKVLFVMNDQVQEKKGILVSGKYYLPIDLVCKQMNQRFFWDNKEKILSYISNDEMTKVELDKLEYKVGIQTKSKNYKIIQKTGDEIYIALEFVMENSLVKCKTYTNPQRIVVISDFDNKYSFGLMKEDTRLRVGPNKKYDYLLEVEEGAQVIMLEGKSDENGYYKVMTADGIVGYLPEDSIEKTIQKKWDGKKKAEEFSQITMSGKVCLAWHQVTNFATNQYLLNTISSATSLNVVSPTWFSLSDNKGNFTSLASDDYVVKAHNSGKKVWALLDNFNTKINETRLLSRTSTRQQLVNNLVAKAIQYGVDGINIDFEKLPKSAAAAYLEFLRELTIKCHANQLVVSVDNYVPASYNAYYDLAEQGRVVDYVIIMAYDEHYAGSETAGSVSSIGFVEKGMNDTLSMVSKDRVVIALPFYTRLWQKTKGGKLSSSAYGMDTAEGVLKQNGAMAKWDDETEQYFSSFKNGGSTYSIWLEEEKSLEAKMKLVNQKKVAGFAFWKLGFERATAWETIREQIQ